MLSLLQICKLKAKQQSSQAVAPALVALWRLNSRDVVAQY
jgi:hypothetical protein